MATPNKTRPRATTTANKARSSAEMVAGYWERNSTALTWLISQGFIIQKHNQYFQKGQL